MEKRCAAGEQGRKCLKKGRIKEKNELAQKLLLHKQPIGKEQVKSI